MVMCRAGASAAIVTMSQNAVQREQLHVSRGVGAYDFDAPAVE